MQSVFQKLNLTTQPRIVVCNAPESFEPELERLKGVEIVRNPVEPRSVRFALAFAVQQCELDAVSAALAAGAEGDAILWFAYPKGTSKRYSCEFNRDTGWRVITAAGFTSVRQVAIDEDWSALRFRRSQFVKSGKAR